MQPVIMCLFGVGVKQPTALPDTERYYILTSCVIWYFMALEAAGYPIYMACNLYLW